VRQNRAWPEPALNPELRIAIEMFVTMVASNLLMSAMFAIFKTSRCEQLGDILVVGLNIDASVRLLKRPDRTDLTRILSCEILALRSSKWDHFVIHFRKCGVTVLIKQPATRPVC